MQLFLNCEPQNPEDSTEVKALMFHITQQQEATQTMWTYPSKEPGVEWKPGAQRREGTDTGLTASHWQMCMHTSH